MDKKIIVVKDCMECPYMGQCSAWDKLTPKQRFTLKTSTGLNEFILKDCPLKDAQKSICNKANQCVNIPGGFKKCPENVECPV